MRRLRSAIWAAAGVLPLVLVAPGLSQVDAPPLPPPPPLEPLSPPDSLSRPDSPSSPGGQSQSGPSADELSSCVPRYGNTGCAARLYARLLCVVVGQNPMPQGLQQQLDGQYERAAIDFRGITVAQVESAALGYYVPMVCPARSRMIQELFAPLAEPTAQESPG